MRPCAARALALAALAALAPAGAAAGEIGLALEAGYNDLTSASRSADAVFGGSGGFMAGALVRFDVSERFFVGAGARVFKREGERVFVADPDSEPFPLGHPLDIRLLPFYGFAGYRFRPGAQFSPYLAVGAGATSFRETSEVGGLEEEESTTKAHGQVMAGFEYGRGSVRFGVELGYSFVPDAVGLGGVTEVYGEDDLGGFSAMGRVVFVP
jgi:opacity protein-like surface antigen